KKPSYCCNPFVVLYRLQDIRFIVYPHCPEFITIEGYIVFAMPELFEKNRSFGSKLYGYGNYRKQPGTNKYQCEQSKNQIKNPFAEHLGGIPYYWRMGRLNDPFSPLCKSTIHILKS